MLGRSLIIVLVCGYRDDKIQAWDMCEGGRISAADQMWRQVPYHLRLELTGNLRKMSNLAGEVDTVCSTRYYWWRVSSCRTAITH
jgi:hypothetical protein